VVVRRAKREAGRRSAERPFGRSTVCALLLIATATPALADDREEARREFAAGQAEDRQHNWQAAIEHYLRANEIVSHPFTVYNIAVDYEHLSKLRESATWYARYLDQTTDPAERTKVQRLIEDMKTRPSRLSVRSPRDGAPVTIDGKPAGHTPAIQMVRGGPHHVAVEVDGQREDRDIVVEYGEPAEVVVQARGGAGGGALLVVGSPPGALVTVDNIPAGQLPLTVPATPGSHHVHVEQIGYRPWDSDFTVEQNQATRVAVTMAPLDGGPIDTGPGETTPHVVKLQYLFGAIGGADARGSGATGLFELGVRYTRFMGVFQAGAANDGGFVGILGRWKITAGNLAPYIGLGLVGNRDGGGFEAEGGFHWDLAKNDRATLAAIATIGVYYYGSVDMAGNKGTSIAVPVSFGIEGTLGN
jgi:PEGA domain